MSVVWFASRIDTYAHLVGGMPEVPIVDMITTTHESNFLFNVDRVPDFLWSESPHTPRGRLDPIPNPGSQTARIDRSYASREFDLSPRRPATTTLVPHRLQPLDRESRPSTRSQKPPWWDMPKNIAKECDRFDNVHDDLSARASGRLVKLEAQQTSELSEWRFQR